MEGLADGYRVDIEKGPSRTPRSAAARNLLALHIRSSCFSAPTPPQARFCLAQVCNKVLADRATDGDVRKARARGLVTMGRIFKAHGSYAAMTKLDVQVHLALQLTLSRPVSGSYAPQSLHAYHRFLRTDTASGEHVRCASRTLV